MAARGRGNDRPRSWLMDRKTALRKVLSCLRLAASSNPNEAAAALRQARALMDEHGLTEADAYASEIHHADAPTRCRGSVPARSLMFLIDIVATGFRCDVVIHRVSRTVMRNGWPASESTTTVRFFGAGSDAEIAAYAFSVLRRQLEVDKGKHTARVRKRANKERRGEEFAIGWISAVRHQFPGAELADDRKAAIARAIESKHTNIVQTAGREVGKHGRASYGDRDAGYIKGSAARVHPGVGDNGPRKLEHAR
ncbi:MAG: DUF2786 domain-containing protein [Rudaea sp.]|uniref:DUF7168 domain-containing protein n=1 Tax=unclassified Rudaea TaxID=2627037 RepID=UPI00148543FA|nr:MULTISPECIES: DUF2786 domain-containing protein [unclassified Rudaea]MBR0347051.1 DUF2786 domain-containing protein [Rudaea sp.]